MSGDSRAEAETAAVAALARREHSAREIERKLRARGFDAEMAREVIGDLIQRGLQSDGRFAEAYLSQRASRGYGPNRIRAELGERGVDEAVTEQALAECELDFAELALRAQRRKFKQAPGSFDERARHTRFLQYRGFGHDHIRHALGQTADDEDI